MGWRPSLIVRFGRSGNVCSLTSTPGYALAGGIAAAMTVGLLAAALSGRPLLLLGLVAPGVFLRDAWAWFAASELERAAFRAHIEELVAHGYGRPGDMVTIGSHWKSGVLVLLMAWFAASVALVVAGYPVFLVSALFAIAVLAAAALDRMRRARGAS